MYQIDDQTAVASMPALGAAGDEGFFTEGNATLGIRGTKLTADFLNILQSELMNLLSAGGITASKSQLAQVLAAVLSCGTYADTGAVNAMASNPTVPIFALVPNMRAIIVPANTNTAQVVTWNLSGLGPIPVLRPDKSLPNIGDLVAGQPYPVIFQNGAWRLLQWPVQRVPISADQTVYCAPNGSDSAGDGTSGNPFATPTFAISWIFANIDVSKHHLKLKLLDGTYAGFALEGLLPGQFDDPASLAVRFDIEGNDAAPGNVIIQGLAAHAFRARGAHVRLHGLSIQSAGTASDGTAAAGIISDQASVLIDNLVYGICNGPHNLAIGGTIRQTSVAQGAFSTGLAITGAAQAFMAAQAVGHILLSAGVVTLTGVPNFTDAFCTAEQSSVVSCPSSTVSFSGGATGKRHRGDVNGVLDSHGGTESTFFPGNVGGTRVNGAQWR